ncbi:MAG: capsular biosynthesis protein [Acidobacteria bacterium]|nr:MAG: capsular biosynthesis protein [Acidobacteriota bacterium]
MTKYIPIFFLAVLLAGTSCAQTPVPTPLDLAGEKQRADRLQARFNDYANFARYREANSKLPPPAKDEQRVVFMGDSITDGWKLDQYFPGAPYVNRGISGQTTSQMLLRFRADVIDLKPKVVVILAGTNDISGNTGSITLAGIENNYASMVDLARTNGINVVFASVMPISDYNKTAQGEPIVRSTQRRPEQIAALNEWIKKYCADRKLVYLDYFSAMADEKGFLKAEIANDGLHPNAKGYDLIKPLAAEAIKAALKAKQK